MESKKKLIYADDLFDVMRDDIDINGSHLAKIKRHIETAPAVDAVEVVRCKDCRKCSVYDDVITRVKQYRCYHWNGYRDVDADFFCAAGERREGE